MKERCLHGIKETLAILSFYLLSYNQPALFTSSFNLDPYYLSDALKLEIGGESLFHFSSLRRLSSLLLLLSYSIRVYQSLQSLAMY